MLFRSAGGSGRSSGKGSTVSKDDAPTWDGTATSAVCRACSAGRSSEVDRTFSVGAGRVLSIDRLRTLPVRPVPRRSARQKDKQTHHISLFVDRGSGYRGRGHI